MLRITSGIFRGRTLQAPSGSQTRPTQAKLRQALFNSIQFSVPDAVVLDLFAGSGALGFEALSRGAERVVFVENSAAAQRLIRKNAEMLEVTDRIQILPRSVETLTEVSSDQKPFDIILADPPYEGDWEHYLLNNLPWARLLKPGGHFCLESGVTKTKAGVLPDEVSGLRKVREKDYGDSRLTTFVRPSSEDSHGD